MDVFPFAGAALAFQRLAKRFTLTESAGGSYGMATDGASLGV